MQNDKGNDKKPGLTWSTPSTNNNSAPASVKHISTSMPLALPKMAPNNGNSTARYVGIFVGGLMFGVVVAWGWSALRNSGSEVATKGTVATANTTSNTKTTKSGTNDTSSVAAAVALGSADMDVTSPQRAGQSVIINSVSVSKPTWVVVYDNNAGKPGNVLGAQLFFGSTNGTVTLLRPTMAGKTYFIGRAVDDGDRKFQKASDKEVTDTNGDPVLVPFTTN